tara:strand:+ start:48 stop:707 length:660 start_codon:yes stop_codon:yes gene_type:complete
MEYLIPKINILNILSLNYNTMNNKNLILEPFCCILRIILLEYKSDGTKISIQNNSIQYYDPTLYQGILRTIYGDNREDIHNLYGPILKGFEWYNTLDSKMNKYFFENLIIGLEKLNKAYDENTIIHHSISHYITMVKDLIDLNDISKFKEPDKKESPLIDNLKNIWDKEEIYIIYKYLNYINNSEEEELKKTYIKNIEDILLYKEKLVEKYINESSTTY